MNDFFSKDGWQFIMFATEDGVINEQPLSINLDGRTISVPSAVATCASVQSDHLAEMLIFEVDRFFDLMDLANTEIYVQWKTGSTEGDTRIAMIDFATKPGKMLFAWPLTDDVTNTPGVVKFSVRFFVKNKAGEVVYSLNTQEASLSIRPALATGFNTTMIDPTGDRMFDSVILNSTKAVYGKTGPAQPHFDGAPASDIALLTTDEHGDYVVTPLSKVDGKFVANLINDTVTFCAMAYTTDLGDIDYEWYHVIEDAAGELFAKKYTIHDEENIRVGNAYIRLPADRMEIEVEEPNLNTRYFEKVDTDLGPTYPSVEFPIEENTVLYEKYSTFTIPKEEVIAALTEGENDVADIVGIYYVAAINHKGGVSTAETPVRSSECVLPGPADIQLKEDLPSYKVIASIMEDDEEIVAPGANIAIEMPENVYNADITYSWEMKDTIDGTYEPVKLKIPRLDDDGEVEVDENDKIIYDEINAPSDVSLNLAELGWYRVKIESKLNRKTIDDYSGECKVTFAPKAPIVTNDSNEFYYFLNSNSDPVTLSITATVDNEGDPLYNEKFKYVWAFSQDGEPKEIAAEHADFAIANGNKLMLQYSAERADSICMIYCTVYNILNNMETPADIGPFIVGFTKI